MLFILSSSDKCDNANIFVKTQYDWNLKLNYQKLSGISTEYTRSLVLYLI